MLFIKYKATNGHKSSVLENQQILPSFFPQEPRIPIYKIALSRNATSNFLVPQLLSGFCFWQSLFNMEAHVTPCSSNGNFFTFCSQ